VLVVAAVEDLVQQVLAELEVVALEQQEVELGLLALLT
jgi:hypothetical protein